MADSPAVRLPLHAQEQPILDKLLEIRTSLEFLKQDKSCFLKSCDVMNLYHQLVEQVNALNRIRRTKRDEQNRVDYVLDDCLQLISLAFMTIGKNSEIPAIYSTVSTIKRLLEHLKEAAFYCNKDLKDLAEHLHKYKADVERAKTSTEQDPHLLTLLEARIDLCFKTLDELNGLLKHLSPEMQPTHAKLVSILRSLSACNVKSKFPEEEVEELRNQIQQIQEQLGVTEVKGSPDMLVECYEKKLRETVENAEEDPQRLVTDLLTRCIIWEQVITARPGRIDEGFRDMFNHLLSIRNQLESRALLQAWSLRETDLYSYQRQLDRCDEARDDQGRFVDPNGNPADLQTQRVTLPPPPPPPPPPRRDW